MFANPKNTFSNLCRRLRHEPLEDRRLLSITVDTLIDEADGSITDGDISLRDAIAAATAGETIDFSVTGTIPLTLGELELTDSLTINGPGSALLTIDARQNSRVFNITSTSGNFTIAGLTLTGGRTTGDDVDLIDNTYNGGAIRSLTSGNLLIQQSVISGNRVDGERTFGGGVFSLGPATLEATSVSYNTSRWWGGGVAADGPLTISGCSIQGNEAYFAGGGGIWARDELTVTESIVSNNSAGRYNGIGGGVDALGPLMVTDCTITGNSAVWGGGGIYFSAWQGDLGKLEHRDAHATIVDSNIQGNSAGSYGGGVFAWISGLTVINSTVSGNSASQGGGIRGGSLTIRASTISGNSATENGGGIFGGGIITSSTISNNSAGQRGGGSYFGGQILDTTVFGNSAEVGGGIFSRSTELVIVDTTISGNTASAKGGGIASYYNPSSSLPGTVQIVGSTIVTNSSGGGVWTDHRNGDLLSLQNSIVAENLHQGIASDLRHSRGTLSVEYSLIGVNSSNGLPDTGPSPEPVTGNLVGRAASPVNPLLGPLADNGGPTKTHLPLAGSPVIDAGNPLAVAAWGDFPIYDQRGLAFDRAIGERLDMGAVEYAASSANFNEDLHVDGRDFLAWQRGYGISSGATQEDGDANSDGAVNAQDRTIWEEQYGAKALYTDPIIVDTLSDSVDGNITTGNFSLREAIAVANHLGGEQTITFAPELFSTAQTLLLTDGDLQILDSLSINGPGAELLTIDAQQNSRIFNSLGPDLNIHGLTLTGGQPAADENGGAILAKNLTLVESEISGNRVTGDGGGGGIRASTALLTRTTVSGNSTNYIGNFASFGHGGGISASIVTLNQSTVSGNTVQTGRGGGISADTVVLDQSTVTGNATRGSVYSTGGGINANNLTIHGSILAGNEAASGNSDLKSEVNLLSVEYSLIGDTSGLTIIGPGNVLNQDPLLAPLANNGGPTQTHALLTGSPAIDTGDPSAVAGVGDTPLYDQRGVGFSRVKGGRIDIGAYEVQPATLASKDFDDVVLWQEPYGQTPPVDSAPSISAGTFSNEAELTAHAGLVDAVMALEWMGAAEPEALTDVVAETYSESVSITQENSKQLLAAVASASELGLQTANEGSSEPTEQVWLSDKLLEEVFGWSLSAI